MITRNSLLQKYKKQLRKSQKIKSKQLKELFVEKNKIKVQKLKATKVLNRTYVLNITLKQSLCVNIPLA